MNQCESLPLPPSDVHRMSADSGRENGLPLRNPPTPTNSSSQATTVKVRGSPSKYVKLNVGGTLFYTTIGTLTKQDNMLRAMFSGRMEVLTDSEGWILIDRSGKHFGTILNFLRDGKASLPYSRQNLEELQAESKYYIVPELVERCQKALKLKKDEYFPVCRIPVITSPREAKMLISKTHKPLVRLLFNRANNKYSYTSASDDNILKNIEMFDKLSIRFNGRVNFVKDVSSGNDEICCWTYYGRCTQVAEISCTSIVYTSEKKQTKVEFPEARILEETLNVLLYERVESSEKDDFDLDMATVSTGCHSDDDLCTCRSGHYAPT